MLDIWFIESVSENYKPHFELRILIKMDQETLKMMTFYRAFHGGRERNEKRNDPCTAHAQHH